MFQQEIKKCLLFMCRGVAWFGRSKQSKREQGIVQKMAEGVFGMCASPKGRTTLQRDRSPRGRFVKKGSRVSGKDGEIVDGFPKEFLVFV